MSETPDFRWQELIDDYLTKLNKWQRVMLKDTNIPQKKIISKKRDKMTIIYEDMKQAERELREYESEKGY